MTTPFRIACLSLAMLLLASQGVRAAEKKPRVASFGTLESLSPEAVQAQAAQWLKSVKADGAMLERFNKIWKQEERPVIERLADSFSLGNADAAKLLSTVRAQVPMGVNQVPALLKSEKLPLFFRANLALAYARNLSNRRAYEEALDALKLFQPEQVVDPPTYLFHRAVCEHALLDRQSANKSIARLLADCADAPERYKNVGLLMFVDMTSWKEKDLAAVARRMENSERRLGGMKPGPKTQKIQKDILARLDELIKEMENKQKKDGSGSGDANGGACPEGGDGPGQASGNQASSPARDSATPAGHGEGNTSKAKNDKRDPGKFIQLEPQEQRRVLQEMLQEIEPRYKEAIENYYLKLIAQSRKSRP